ncbi:MAG: UDP-4-amino-4,6-dideoxy-N-acetyl-beta-L-altrosamine transaminase [Alphaproteobacteria bacterium]|jgi:UDP-4-amino-4,6-dideoxy-N-acetyl-beta-L-altrosamine transaminase|nr:UDP-4-amino-4,6-dideoxy-N-acetyl-beta-L-altrosamine transaminase [Alphaproteobacteria bacterium]MBU2040787.1 UDP-4-amino-4,6-dideoxy-N-acetyl-beta-L-altrosamine transaminase [Alphaproteobacteria bacterium]MBU2207897.1 UDP-4-amino-4,6-dideoxy-N-acetyl-beta-L-altrosamine transaminase [Alphaproteobacteria bacterium]MBU2291260.1 UDP-4-amino-4,6-dideoxy-N-acetyl-beta-L-altrosamine transaminase [Alphaproteobacteria bacterium]MBU2396694.1 UDP-4-amino-4,6-dideoxy-N-acetyl-beta-L-altrosamine transami
MIPYGRQDISQEDIDAVVETLRSDFLTQGPAVPRFEKVVADYVGATHAVAVNSATSALHIACLALGLGPGDWLWTSPITFVASANCALYCGANVSFVDIDPDTYNLSVEDLERRLISAERDGRLPKIVVPVHLCGQSCDMAAIADLAKRFQFKLIEDASHAIGGRYGNGSVGNCRYSDITILSFHPVKIVTTAEGGMALTNDDALAAKMALLRSHGITRDPSSMDGGSEGPWYYQQIDLGFNYRMTEMQAALGLSQMARIETFVSRRQDIARRYDELFRDTSLVRPVQKPYAYSAYHLYPVRVSSAIRREVFESLRESGIGVNVHYIPVHLQPYYRAMGFAPGDYPEAERYYAEAISLPLFPAMTDMMQDQVVAATKSALQSAKGT